MMMSRISWGMEAARTPSRSMKVLMTLVLSCLVPWGAWAVNTVPIEGHVYLQPDVPPPSTKVTLNGGAFATLTRADGSFSFQDVPAGTYLLDVLSPTHHFSQIKISVRPDSDDQVLCLEYKYPGAAKLKAAYPLLILAHSGYSYFERRDSWAAIRAQLSSPMTWMMLASVAMAFFFPKMLSGMDEESKRELEEQFKATNPQSLMDELLGGGAKKKEEAKRVEAKRD